MSVSVKQFNDIIRANQLDKHKMKFLKYLFFVISNSKFFLSVLRLNKKLYFDVYKLIKNKYKNIKVKIYILFILKILISSFVLSNIPKNKYINILFLKII
jgi:hypothetical protein